MVVRQNRGFFSKKPEGNRISGILPRQKAIVPIRFSNHRIAMKYICADIVRENLTLRCEPSKHIIPCKSSIPRQNDAFRRKYR
jgi:hypothetical protein